MAELITITIDGHKLEVPAGTLVVDAAKRIGVDIPVFCYHPKMEPVGMCRVCLVDVGTPLRDRVSGQPVLEADGTPKIGWGPKLQTGCTVRVSAGMAVRTNTAAAEAARKEILEFLLTSHPLDCPICDKGGECPLQNLTVRYGPSNSRFLSDEKIHFAKHYPLGDLIYLDRERCIQCARCVRFQEDIAGDPVIGFQERGRNLQIVTYSEPGFDSKFSGNTTDICPVGALTTADFRFGARAWEMQNAASICNGCAVGCNIHLNTRRSGKSGDFVVKRVMPRQNEAVNEIWLCDKGRFAHHFATSPDRLTQPQIRKNGKLTDVTWEEALALLHSRLQKAYGSVASIAGERLPNEDLFALQKLTKVLGGKIAAWPGVMAGGDLAQQVGVGQGTDFAQMGAGTVILVVGCDLEETAPVLWLRVKQAATKQGATLDKSQATLLVANARATKTDRYASQVLRYNYGDEVRSLLAMLHGATGGKSGGLAATLSATANDAWVKAGKTIAEAKNVVILYGNEGLDFAGSQAVAQACANLLIATEHYGKPNNGLLPVWQHVNTQGAWDLGIAPIAQSVSDFAGAAQVLLLAGADPVGDGEALPSGCFVVVSELFSTATARAADVVLPAQSFVERDGTYTNTERRVQRFYPAIPAKGQAKPDWYWAATVAQKLGGFLQVPAAAAQLFGWLAKEVPAYAGLTYQQLAQVTEQFPQVGGDDKYYGGTAFENTAGLGAQTATTADKGYRPTMAEVSTSAGSAAALQAVPVTLLYDRGTAIMRSYVLHPRLPQPYVELNQSDADTLGIADGDAVQYSIAGQTAQAAACVNQHVPAGVVLVPQSLGGIAFVGKQPVQVQKH
jgi:NADH-quinone oxidoreductase subunit G